MNLKEQQELYERFQSKVESACWPMVYTRADKEEVKLSDSFINNNIIPKLWEDLQKHIDNELSKQSKKVINL